LQQLSLQSPHLSFLPPDILEQRERIVSYPVTMIFRIVKTMQ